MKHVNVVVRVAVFIGLPMMVAGCESAQQAGGMKSAVDDYNAQRYLHAQQKAIAIQEKSKRPGDREDAAYLAGLSAYQLGQSDEAEKRLMTAIASSNSQTKAKATAMLAQIRMDQRRPRDAASLFVQATSGLQGEDARRCAYNAGVAFQQAGDTASAKKWLAQVGGAGNVPGPSSSTAVASATVQTSNVYGFTLQVGAFREKKHAQQAAEEAQKLASSESLGRVRVITRRDERGSALYVVQFGTFPSRAAAALVRSKLGRLDYIVAPAMITS